jgi:hypothetical protein
VAPPASLARVGLHAAADAALWGDCCSTRPVEFYTRWATGRQLFQQAAPWTEPHWPAAVRAAAARARCACSRSAACTCARAPGAPASARTVPWPMRMATTAPASRYQVRVRQLLLNPTQLLYLLVQPAHDTLQAQHVVRHASQRVPQRLAFRA